MGDSPCESALSLVEPGPPEDTSPLAWAWTCLPPEILEMLWARVPPSERALLSKYYYREWCALQLAATANTYSRRDTLNLSRLLRRQVLLNHQYTFGVLLDMRAKAWNSRRPWRTDIERFPSFLWYLERLCAQAGRDEMRGSVRHAIDRYEGLADTPAIWRRPSSCQGRQRQKPGGLRRHCNWVSIA